MPRARASLLPEQTRSAAFVPFVGFPPGALFVAEASLASNATSNGL
jgi:hypothetical protein